MRVQIYDTYEEMSRAAADLVAAQLLQKPNCHLGLTAGSTPVGLCAELVNLYKEHRVSFAECTLYNLEEMADIPPEDPKQPEKQILPMHTFWIMLTLMTSSSSFLTALPEEFRKNAKSMTL